MHDYYRSAVTFWQEMHCGPVKDTRHLMKLQLWVPFVVMKFHYDSLIYFMVKGLQVVAKCMCKISFLLQD